MNTIVLTFDKNYGPAACTTLTSVFINNPYTDFEVDIIYTSTSAELEKALDTLSALYHRTINRHLVEESFLDQFDISGHFTRATYLRLLIPELIKQDLILYLDCDLIVQTSIAKLFELANGRRLVGVSDLAGTRNARNTLKLTEGDPYINAGVLAFDNRIWREEGISALIIDFYRHNKERITWHDQCAINGALAGYKTIADKKYNVLYQDIEFKLLQQPEFSADTFDGIFHYNAAIKPWYLWCKKDYKALWDKYASVSPLAPAYLDKPRSMYEWYLMAENYETDNNFKAAASIYKNLYNLMKDRPSAPGQAPSGGG